MISDDHANVKSTLMATGMDLKRIDFNELILKVYALLIFLYIFIVKHYYLNQLEKHNPTTDPAFSNLLNGVWELVLCGVGSPGLVAYQVIKIHYGC